MGYVRADGVKDWAIAGKLLGYGGTSYDNVFSKEVIDEIARDAQLTIDEAEYIYELIGKIIQRRLMSAKPCGIPYVGTLYVGYYCGKDKVIPCNDRHIKPTVLHTNKVPHPVPRVKWSKNVKIGITALAPYVESLSAQYKNARIRRRGK